MRARVAVSPGCYAYTFDNTAAFTRLMYSMCPQRITWVGGDTKQVEKIRSNKGIARRGAGKVITRIVVGYPPFILFPWMHLL